MSEQEIEVVCVRSGKTLTIPPGTSILSVFDENRVRVRRSCRQGICRTCEVEVLEGVPDHRDSVLSAQERAAGKTMMVCVSRALTPRLVLNV